MSNGQTNRKNKKTTSDLNTAELMRCVSRAIGRLDDTYRRIDMRLIIGVGLQNTISAFFFHFISTLVGGGDLVGNTLGHWNVGEHHHRAG